MPSRYHFNSPIIFDIQKIYSQNSSIEVHKILLKIKKPIHKNWLFYLCIKASIILQNLLEP
jgi:hypothetical protein